MIGVTGNLEAGKAVGRAVGSGINAVGSYITARKNGANIGGSLAAAGASFAITYVTASLSGIDGLDVFTATMADATIGLGGALCNSAITSGIANASSNSRTNSNKSNKSNKEQWSLPMKNTVTSRTLISLR